MTDSTAQQLGAEDLREVLKKPKNSEAVQTVVSSIIGSLKNDFADLEVMMYKEISTLSQYITEAKQQVSVIPAEINKQQIPDATDELDAVISATEEATQRILDAADKITNAAAGAPPEIADQLNEAVTEIFEASTFQDITGQRIGKVVAILKNIESRISELLERFSTGIVMQEIKHVEKTGDSALMNGPQLAHKAKNQDEIDALFSKA